MQKNDQVQLIRYVVRSIEPKALIVSNKLSKTTGRAMVPVSKNILRQGTAVSPSVFFLFPNRYVRVMPRVPKELAIIRSMPQV